MRCCALLCGWVTSEEAVQWLKSKWLNNLYISRREREARPVLAHFYSTFVLLKLSYEGFSAVRGKKAEDERRCVTENVK